MAIRQVLLEELLKDHKPPDDLLGLGGLLKELSKALIEKDREGGNPNFKSGTTKWGR